MNKEIYTTPNRMLIRLKDSQYNKEIDRYLFNRGSEITVITTQKIEYTILGDRISDLIDRLSKLDDSQIEEIHISFINK